MDQIDISSLSLTSKPLNRNEKIPWPEASSMKQCFSLPDSIIFYMAKNPSTPKCYLKLAQSCKYFFEKLPLLIVSRIYDDGKMFCSSSHEDMCDKKNGECCVKIDLAKITNKIWITNELSLDNAADIPNIISMLLPKLYQCENSSVLVLQRCTLFLDDFKILALKFQKFDLFYAEIIDNEENPVMLDVILENLLPSVTDFEYCFYERRFAATPLTFKNIAKLKNLKNLRNLYLSLIPLNTPVEDILELITRHKETYMSLDFRCERYNFRYKTQLDVLVDTIIESKRSNVVISYDHQDRKKYMLMKFP